MQRGALLFDPIAAAAASIEISLDLLLDGSRAARLVDQARRDESLPSFRDVLDALVSEALPAPGTLRL